MKKGNVTGQMASSMEEAKELLEELHAFPRQKANNLPILISFLKKKSRSLDMNDVNESLSFKLYFVVVNTIYYYYYYYYYLIRIM